MSFSLYGFLIGLAWVLFWYRWETALQSTPTKLTARQLGAAWLVVTLGTLVGARLYHVATDWWRYQGNVSAIWQTWSGGLGVYGALGGGGLGLLIWSKLAHPPYRSLQIWDAAALAVPLAQALGRWGNFFNQELFGPPTTLPWGIFIAPEQRPITWLAQTHFHPLFLYESLTCLALGGFLWFIFRRYRSVLPLGSGFYSGLYLFTYGSTRFGLEWLRWDAAMWGPLSVAQWISVGCVGLGLLLLSRIFRLQ